MNKIKLGIFVALGLFAIMVSILAVGNLNFGSTYNIYVSFPNAAGLTKKAKVKIAGVDVGVLKSVSLKGDSAYLKLSIQGDVVLYKNATASIVSMGIIGTKYIEIKPGNPNFQIVKNNEEILMDTTGGSLEDILGNLAKKLDKAFNNDKTGDLMQNISEAVYDLKLITKNISSQNERIASIIENFDIFSQNIADLAIKLDTIAQRIEEGDGTIAKLVNDEEMSKDLKETVANAKQTVESLKEAIGTGRRLRLAWDYTGRYNSRDSKFRNDLGIKMSLRDERYYYVGISNVADSKEVKDSSEKDIINKLNAWIGFRGTNAEIYGGVIRGKGGLGFGYSIFDSILSSKKRLYVGAKAYDLGRKKHGPQIDLDLRAGIFDWLYAGVAVEDTIYRASVTPYIKLEIKDTDIASLLGIAGLASVASK